MRKLLCAAILLLMVCCAALAEEAVPYFEEYELPVYEFEDLGTGIMLEDGFNMIAGQITSYPLRVNYNIISDEVVNGVRDITVRMIVEAEDLDWSRSNGRDLIFYAVYDYYTGQQFYIEVDMQNPDTEMRDFTVEYAGKTYEISGRATNARGVLWENGAYYLWDYEMEMSPDYDGLLLGNFSMISYADRQELSDKLNADFETGLPPVEDMGDDAYRAVYVRIR